jgi:hypothetical protein
MERLAPIALFVYKRLDHTKKTLNALRKNPEFSRSPIYVFADGPKTEEERPATREVREFVRSLSLANLTLVESEKNRGLAASVISGVTQVVGEHGKIIVLEDDLVVSPSFLAFMNRALDFYEHREKVMHVSGYMYPLAMAIEHPFFFRNASSWGWGTWERAWKKFEPNAEKLLASLAHRRLRHEFDILGAAKNYDMLRLQSRSKLDSWAIRWDATLFLNSGLSFYPPKTLVRNIGMDGSGTHRESTTDYESESSTRGDWPFPTEITEDLRVVRAMRDFYRAMRPALPVRLWRRIASWPEKIAGRLFRFGREEVH